MRIMKKGMELKIYDQDEGEERGEGDQGRKEPEVKKEDKGKKKQGISMKKSLKVEGPFVWTNEHEHVLWAIKHAKATNAMAPPDPDLQYHLAVDASQRGIGRVLFQ